MIKVIRTSIRIKAEPERVVAKYLYFEKKSRVKRIISDVLNIDEHAVEHALQRVLEEFESRHPGFRDILMDNFHRIEDSLASPGILSHSRKLLLGSYFTHEYSVESAALFNPSIVIHPDQAGLNGGELRFVLGMRACGEGHISSIVFTSGIISRQGDISLDPRPSKLACQRINRKEEYNKAFIVNRDYNFSFDEETELGSRVIFPSSVAESGGMEDVRFVEFSERGKTKYIGTYTAYDGKKITPAIIETRDFNSFKIRALRGRAATGKGMALLPEKIDGQYAMIGRQGGESLSIMYSKDLHCWDSFKAIQKPERDWEITQLGNCGSPLKTPSGWLLLTHAVGPMRKYVISASLLDLHDPRIVLSSLDEPLIYPENDEREGYVPNVVYTCGMMRHFDNLIIPYAMSDSAISFARVDINTLINKLLNK